ncbi:MAG: hypothetical protein K8T26_11185 [Lentisphaerae bacterium]|nr:hypothetical protein [Lentisphaerota bacterium]
MTNRELFQRIMHYGEFDRMPVVHWGGWAETMERWFLDPRLDGSRKPSLFIYDHPDVFEEMVDN